MASPELLNVVALDNKAMELYDLGHVARALDYQGRAVAAAQALGAEDCIIVASLQIRHVRLLYTDVHSKRYEGVSLSHAQELLAPLASLFFAAADTVQRRLAAGTLLEGTCRAAEVTWLKLTQEHAVKCAPGMSRVDASRAIAVMASFCGYTTLLEVAEFTPRMLDRVDRGLIAMTEQQLSTSLS